jgi:hypothetical protein
MNDKTLSSKERALLEAARREVGAKAPPREVAGTAGPGAPRPQARPAAPGRAAPRAPVSPLDAPTVLGWDHPAAQGAPPKPEDEKWARVAVLMERERRDADARRRRTRRNGFAVVAVLVVIMLIVFARALLR